MVMEKGQLFGFFLIPGSYSDTSAYRPYDFDLSNGRGLQRTKPVRILMRKKLSMKQE
jgi:hypothetical protein